ncbi:MAG: helix-turn-helix domain-containing protein [Oscillospiraceae bacterium]|jgi:transcriptional regulator with XRE-family HTH domain|nr:helix-turn-helix domain-containing protein [Oscillospiraceae bacterium]
MKLNVDAIGKKKVTVSEDAFFARLASNLKWLRGAYGLNQQTVADYLGVDRSAYCFYETQKCRPSVFTLKRLADFYELGMDDLTIKDLSESSF